MKILYKLAIFFGYLFIASLSYGSDSREVARLKKSVVKIYTSSSSFDYFTPWALMGNKQSSGSGAVISGNRILTNAHVVADARYIQVQKSGKPKKYLARRIFVSHEADLALLTVEDTSFFTGVNALSFGPLPKPLQEVAVYGYPIGGNSLSVTKGILSRIEHQNYAHANSYLLAGQVDAAINPGNSGGPVIVNKKIVGVVMQSIAGGRAENLGYFVPPSVIEHVLADSEDGKNDGFPQMGLQLQKMDSPAMKAYFDLEKDDLGALVVDVSTVSSAYSLLKPNDVILEIDGFKIADDLSVEFLPGLRTHLKYIFDLRQIGDELEFVISRAGQQQKLKIPLDDIGRDYSLVAGQKYDEIPRYYIYGGIVFVPLNMNLIKRWGRDWAAKAPMQFLNARDQWSTDSKQEVIVALKVLPTDVNLGYHDVANWVFDYINDEAISTFEQFCGKLKYFDDEFVILKDRKGYQMVLDHKEALENQEKVLTYYQIPSIHSEGLSCQM